MSELKKNGEVGDLAKKPLVPQGCSSSTVAEDTFYHNDNQTGKSPVGATQHTASYPHTGAVPIVAPALPIPEHATEARL